MDDTSSFDTAVIMAKGFGVGTGTEEFRLIWPRSGGSGRIQLRLQAPRDWGEVLEPLYGRTPEDLSRQYAILLDGDEVGVLGVAPTTDGFGRRSMVIGGLVGTRGSEGDADRLSAAVLRVRGGIADISVGLSRGSDDALLTAIKRLSAAAPSASEGHNSRMYAEVLGSNHKGAATPLLLGLGVDVVIGTAHEARRAERDGWPVTAYLDARSGELKPLGPADQTPQEGSGEKPKPLGERFRDLQAEVQELNGELTSLSEAHDALRSRFEHELYHLWEVLNSVRAEVEDLKREKRGFWGM